MATYVPTGALSVFPTDEVVEEALERLPAAAPPPPLPPPTPASTPASVSSPPPPSQTCAAGDGKCAAGKSRGTVTDIAGMATATATMAAEAGAYITSPRSRWSLLVAVITTLVVYVGTKMVRVGLRVREWIISTIFVRNIDWKTPKRHALLKDTTGWRKERVGIDMQGIIGVLHPHLSHSASPAKKGEQQRGAQHADLPNAQACSFCEVAPKALQGLRALVKRYQGTNVFLITEASSKKQEQAVLEWVEWSRVLLSVGIPHDRPVFSNVLYFAALHSKCNRALTFENVCQLPGFRAGCSPYLKTGGRGGRQTGADGRAHDARGSGKSCCARLLGQRLRVCGGASAARGPGEGWVVLALV